jgi:hypothetical protein
MELHEQLREFLRLERGASEVSPCAEWTIIAIPLTCGGKQGFQKFDLFAVGELGRVDENSSLFFGCEASRPRRLTARLFRLFKRHLLRERLEGFELVHASIIEQIFWKFK